MRASGKFTLNHYSRSLISASMGLMTVASPGYAETPSVQQTLTQQQQNAARQEQLAPENKSLLSADGNPVTGELVLPEEQPCYLINKINIENKNSVAHWMSFSDIKKKVEGQCIGVKGVKSIHTAIQNRLISHGYITTRVLLPEQNLSSGNLTLNIMPGKIENIVIKDTTRATVHEANNFPEKKGDVLDLRGLEQAIENLQRVPGSTAEINLLPGTTPGETLVEVTRNQPKRWRLGAWTDDSGSKYTGRNQGGLALYLDNPLTLNDMFYIAYGGGLKNEDGRRSDNVSAWYSVPWGYWLLELNAAQYRYTQTIHSGDFSYLYSGDDKLLIAQLSRVIFRNASQKTTLGFKVIKRDSSYHLNDVEVEVQHRDTTNWKFSLEHQAYFSLGNLKLNLAYQHAVKWFGEKADAEEISGSADAAARILTMSVDGSFPFKLGNLLMSYEPHFIKQYSPDRLTQPDKFTIGNRWTVRGFDGETTLYADKGWYQRNDINLNLPSLGMQPYLGFDYGEVSGSDNDYWNGQHIAGAAIGIRGVKGKIGYDIFAGVPVLKPHEMSVSPYTVGFSLRWEF